MWFYVLSFLLRASLAWWPGPPGTATDSDPEYPHRIVVENTLKPLDHLGEALAQWNACHSVHLVRGAPGDIIITRSDDGGAYGGWNGTNGVVLLGDGWTHTREVITHEVGHALGFGHAPDSTKSIMNAASYVKPLDCEGLRRYYG